MIKKITIFLFSVFLLFTVTANAAQAALHLSVNPLDDTSSLRLGRLTTSRERTKEVRIRISSTDSQPYQVFQRIANPLVNEQGEILDRNVIRSSTLVGSNTAGSLYLNSPQRLSSTDQLMYTSSRDGLSDSFSIVYEVNSDEINTAGNFYGEIIFTARSTGSAQRDEVVLSVYLDASGDFKIEFKTYSGADSIQLSTETSRSSGDYAEIEFSGNLGDPLTVSQEVIQIPVNETNDPLDLTAIQYSLSAQIPGIGDSPATPLSRMADEIIETKDTEGTIRVNYQLKEDAQYSQKAGHYEGLLRFVIQSGDVRQTKDVNLVVDISPIFELSIEYPQGGMVFEKVIPRSPPQDRQIIVRVKTNREMPYSVTQKMVVALTNEGGDVFDKEHFLIKEELLEKTNGRLEYPKFAPLDSEDTTLFYSDNNGSPAVFSVIYRLTPYLKMQPGQYRASFVFSLGEI